MADTARSITDVLTTLLADNTEGAISPQDMRDTVTSIALVKGGIYVTGGSTAQTGIGTSFVKFTGFTTNRSSQNVTPDATNDKLTVLVDGLYSVFLETCWEGTVNTQFTMNVHVNGSPSSFQWIRGISNVSSPGSCSMSSPLSLSANDYLECYIKANGTSKSFTAIECSLWVTI